MNGWIDQAPIPGQPLAIFLPLPSRHGETLYVFNLVALKEGSPQGQRGTGPHIQICFSLELSGFDWGRGEGFSPLQEHEVLPELLSELQNSTTFFLVSHFILL